MAFIDGTVVNVALPALQAELNASVVDVQWVVESYALLLAALLLAGGSLGDRFGRRLVYAIGISIFAVASAWCGLVPSIEHLIIARAVQGIGAALLVPGSLAIISVSFAETERGRAIGTWSGFTSITAAAGPVIGGWLIQNVSWRAAFFINIPIAAVVLLLIFWRVPESRGNTERTGVDWLGTLLAMAGLGGLVYGLIESSNIGFGDVRVRLALIGGSGLMAGFLLVESRVKNAMLPLSLFRSRNFSGTNILTLFLYSALSGVLFFYPLNLIQVQGYSPMAAGAALLPFILIMFLLSRWSGGLVKVYGSRLPLAVGPMIAAAGFLLFAVPGTGNSYWTTFFPAVIVLGLGMAISVAPLTTTVMNSVPSQQAGIASGLNNAVSRIAGVLSVAVFGVVMLHAFGGDFDRRLSSIELAESARKSIAGQRIKLAGLEPPAELDGRTRTEVDEAKSAAFVSGFRVVTTIGAALAFLAGLTGWIVVGESWDARKPSAKEVVDRHRPTRQGGSASAISPLP
jgi:EmrB/QacA subfamily drug resistance transporter